MEKKRMSALRTWKVGVAALAVAFVVGILAVGCASTSAGKALVYDKTVPEENLVELFIANPFDFRKSDGTFDGQKVNWTYQDTILIPAGKHTLDFGYRGSAYDASSRRQYNRYSNSNMNLTYDFQPGRKYALIDKNAAVKDMKADIIPQIAPIGFIDGVTPSSGPTKFEGKWRVAGFDGDLVFKGWEFENPMLFSKGFFDFTDTELRLHMKWSRASASADWVEVPLITTVANTKFLNRALILSYTYQFDADGNLVLNVLDADGNLAPGGTITYQKVAE